MTDARDQTSYQAYLVENSITHDEIMNGKAVLTIPAIETRPERHVWLSYSDLKALGSRVFDIYRFYDKETYSDLRSRAYRAQCARKLWTDQSENRKLRRPLRAVIAARLRDLADMIEGEQP